MIHDDLENVNLTAASGASGVHGTMVGRAAGIDAAWPQPLGLACADLCNHG